MKVLKNNIWLAILVGMIVLAISAAIFSACRSAAKNNIPLLNDMSNLAGSTRNYLQETSFTLSFVKNKKALSAQSGLLLSKKSRKKIAPFNNGQPANGVAWFGATNGDGKNKGTGWPKQSDMQRLIDLGVKTIRIPILPRYCLNAEGLPNEWVLNNLKDNIKFNMRHGVSTVIDAHTYLPFTDPRVGEFWSVFGPALEIAIGGPSPLFGIELANEPGKNSKDLRMWTEPLRKTIKDVRNAGYEGYIFAGAGDWNNMTFLPNALAEVERTGGVTAMDPLNRTIYTGHDYWNKDSDPDKTRNDRGQWVDGTINIARRYDRALIAARKIGAKIVLGEIGGGISPNGPIPAFNGIGKDGRQLQEEYFSYAKANEDVLIGTWFWMAGKTSAGYRHKIEAGNTHTISLQKFWRSRR